MHIRAVSTEMNLVPGKIMDGVVTHTDEFGSWAIVPGSNSELYVSTLGWVHQYDTHGKKWYPPHQNKPTPVKGDVLISHRGKVHRVHVLMAEAFFGPQPSKEHTVDHIEKYNGDFVKERSHNRIENLRWATKQEQALNRNKQTPRRDGQAVMLWKDGESKNTAICFKSSLAAAKALGINAGGISRTAKGDGRQNTVSGWRVEKLPPSEPLKIADDEEFRLVSGFLVSQYGRARDPQTELFSFTPRPRKGQEYSILTKGGKNFIFHRLVAEAWPDIVGERPNDPSATIDHKNRNKKDNRANNLRWATVSQQNQNKTLTQKPRRQATRVELRSPSSSQYQLFETLMEASKHVPLGTISTSLRMDSRGRTISKGKFKGWSIRRPLDHSD